MVYRIYEIERRRPVFPGFVKENFFLPNGTGEVLKTFFFP